MSSFNRFNTLAFGVFFFFKLFFFLPSSRNVFREYSRDAMSLWLHVESSPPRCSHQVFLFIQNSNFWTVRSGPKHQNAFVCNFQLLPGFQLVYSSCSSQWTLTYILLALSKTLYENVCVFICMYVCIYLSIFLYTNNKKKMHTHMGCPDMTSEGCVPHVFCLSNA